MRGILFLLALSICSPAIAASYEGKWVRLQAHCKIDMDNIKEDETPPDSTITIFGKKYNEWEASCTIKSARKTETRQGDTWRMSLDCSGEGERWKKTLAMSVDGDVATIDKGSGYLRCPQ